MKTILIPLFILFISLNISAQKKINKEKIKALKIAHITEQLDLTEKEAQVFWPIYNANEKARHKLRENGVKKLKKENIEAFTEEEAQAHLNAISKMEYARIELQKQYENKLKNILSAKKILKLMEADRSFRDKMIRVFKERHRDSRQIKKKN